MDKITKGATIEEVVALFHANLPDWVELKEIRNQPEDHRWIAFVESGGVKTVIKIAANSFTTPERVSAWPKLIAEFAKLGYYSPALLPSLNGNIVETVVFRDVRCVVWEEEFARYPFADSLPKDDAEPSYTDGLIEFMGHVAQLHLSGFPGKSGWVRLEPFAEDEQNDEITDCLEEFDLLVHQIAPRFIPQWREIRQLFEENREQLRQIYGKLPTSVFQGDWGEGNLLVDGEGRFAGLIDYNLAGEDTALNMFLSMCMSMGAYARQFSKLEDPEEELPYLNPATRQRIIDRMLSILHRLRQYYRFSAEEAQAAPLLFKYIATVEYAAIHALRENAGNNERLAKLFDFLRGELLRDDIDFNSAMLG